MKLGGLKYDSIDVNGDIFISDLILLLHMKYVRLDRHFVSLSEDSLHDEDIILGLIGKQDKEESKAEEKRNRPFKSFCFKSYCLTKNNVVSNDFNFNQFINRTIRLKVGKINTKLRNIH